MNSRKQIRASNGDLPCAKKHAAASVRVDAAAFGAFVSAPNVFATGVDTISKEGANPKSNSSHAESSFFPTYQPAPKRNPRIWFEGHKIAVGEGQEEVAKNALIEARNAYPDSTDDAWKAV